MQCDALVINYCEIIYNGILFRHKEGNPPICNNMDKPAGHYAREINQTTERQILYDLIPM